MLTARVQDAFNKQINEELFSSYLYLSMAACFASRNLKGMAHWMRLQVQEEAQHAMKFLDFINDRGGRVVLTQVAGPKTGWGSALEVFEETCAHESKVTGLINDLVDLSLAEKDHAAATFLQWFVTEQVEEEANVQEIRDKLKLAGDNPMALLMLDQELGQRALPAAPAADG